ncbi:hypothetical protein Lfu02_21880 [Longispora fulva]|nr:hypothetical protein Lfu02_21880 [Longispora fulva]
MPPLKRSDTPPGPVTELFDRLHELHLDAGEPSTRRIAKLTDGIVAFSTVYSIFRGPKVPGWGLLELVVDALGGNEDEFRRLWKAAIQAERLAQSSETRSVGDLGKLAGRPHEEPTEHNHGGITSGLLLSDTFQLVLDTIESMGETPVVVPTGFVDLDRLLSGLQPGTITAITGEPTVGKLTLAMDLLRTVAIRHGMPCILYTANLTKVDATYRILSAEARVPLHVIRSGQLSDDDWTKLARRMGEVTEAPLMIDDAALMTVEEMCDQALAIHAELPLRLVVVDTLLPPQRDESRRALADLRALARRLNCPVVVVGPLDSLPAPGTAPGVANVDPVVFESADVVIVLHREELHDVETPRVGEADLLVVKHRNGPRDTITVAAQLHLCRFVDIAAY